MISFRYHVVSLVAVFLALALGIIVGTTALNGPITDDLRKRVDTANNDRSQLAAQLAAAQSQNSDANAFVTQFGGLAVKDALKDQKVLIVELPGASSDVVSRLTTQLGTAGATLTGTVAMTSDFFSTARAADIKSLVTNGSQPTTFVLPSTDDAVALGGALLAFVLTGKGETTDLSQTISSFSTLQMLEVSGATAPQPADHVIVVGTDTPSDAETGQAEATFASSFQQQGAKTVVAGNTAADTAPGVVATIRANDTLSKTLSTVDNADTAMGQISVILALTENAQVGAYGGGDDANAPYPKLTS